MTVADNITLPSMDKVSGAAGFIRFGQEQEVARDYIARLSIRTPSARQVTRLLSGGNQQKIVIAKWLYRGSRILFFDEPTRGIDVGAKAVTARTATASGRVLVSAEVVAREFGISRDSVRRWSVAAGTWQAHNSSTLRALQAENAALRAQLGL